MDTVYESEFEAIDDVFGAALDESMVRQLRSVVMDFFERFRVYTRVSKTGAKKLGVGGFIMEGRWLDISKGDTDRPDYRSRFVGKEFSTGTDPELFAATPPLEAMN